MRLKQCIQIILVGMGVMALVACSSKHKYPDQSSVSEVNEAYDDQDNNDQAESSGLGQESGFNEQTKGGSQHAANKRVYYFDFDSNTVHEDDRPAIDANADSIAAHPKAKVMLEGHTDPRGSREYNIGLGERRAKAVAAILTAKGVNRAKVRVVSYGAEKLAAQGHSEEAYQKDRRVVLVYLQK